MGGRCFPAQCAYPSCLISIDVAHVWAVSTDAAKRFANVFGSLDFELGRRIPDAGFEKLRARPSNVQRRLRDALDRIRGTSDSAATFPSVKTLHLRATCENGNAAELA